MSDQPKPGTGNLVRPWQPGESGNPDGSSRRQRARAAAKRIGGLAPALRRLLDEKCPEELLGTLTAEQRAGLDGDETLARFLAARLVTSAASSTSLAQLVAALQLIGTIDGRNQSGDEGEAVSVELPPLSPEAALVLLGKIEQERF